MLEDKETERLNNFNLTSSVARAAQSKLFDGYTVFIGANVKPSIDVFKFLVEIHGGHVSVYITNVRNI